MVELRGGLTLLSTANTRRLIRVYGKINIVPVVLKQRFSIKFGHLITSVLSLSTRYDSVEHTNMLLIVVLLFFEREDVKRSQEHN